MSEVVRLIRLTFVLRFLVYALSAVFLLTSFGSQVAVATLLVAIPSIAFLATFEWIYRSGRLTARRLRETLVGLIVLYGVEITLTTLLLDSLPADVYQHPARFIPPLVFCFVPATLGAWFDGRARALRWAALAFATSLLCTFGAVYIADTSMGVDWLATATQTAVLAPACYFTGVIADRMRDEQAELARANDELAEMAAEREALAASRERLRMARDLHDTLAHTLAGLVAELRLGRKLADSDPAALRVELAHAEAAAVAGLQEARAAIADLRSNPATQLGLAIALRQLTEAFEQRTGLRVEYDHQGDARPFADARADTLYRIAEEALHNVECHSGARVVTVRLIGASARERASLTIADDGDGFDLNQDHEGHYGLRGMQEQAALVNGELSVSSAPGAGTVVTVTLS